MYTHYKCYFQIYHKKGVLSTMIEYQLKFGAKYKSRCTDNDSTYTACEIFVHITEYYV